MSTTTAGQRAGLTVTDQFGTYDFVNPVGGGGGNGY
jgi:hypothetical protein